MSPEPEVNTTMDDDVAEPEPDTVGVASGTAKCHHCGKRIVIEGDEWLHEDTWDWACV